MSGGIGGGTVWLDERLRGIVKEYLVAPIPRISILMGNALSTVTKSLMQAGVIFVVGLLMGAKLDLNPLGWIGGIVLVGAYGLGFTGIALAVASKAGSAGAYHMLIFMLNLPLLFLSNALYPLKTLPTAMEIGARLNPTTYVVDGLRQMVLKDATAMSGGADAAAGLMLRGGGCLRRAGDVAGAARVPVVGAVTSPPGPLSMQRRGGDKRRVKSPLRVWRGGLRGEAGWFTRPPTVAPAAPCRARAITPGLGAASHWLSSPRGKRPPSGPLA